MEGHGSTEEIFCVLDEDFPRSDLIHGISCQLPFVSADALRSCSQLIYGYHSILPK